MRDDEKLIDKIEKCDGMVKLDFREIRSIVMGLKLVKAHEDILDEALGLLEKDLVSE